ncbi:MAG: DUF1893 domain-containing protein [Clostridia bacterium]|nr:DUF1893 domain-containing protein [Clostridia bacterium]
MTDSERAKEILYDPSAHHTCVLCKGDTVYASEKTGIAPMMDLLDSGAELSGFCAADRIVGRAAAMLFVLAGVRSLYAEVITEGAIRILTENGISYAYQTRTEQIVNRRGDGPCPMESAVAKVENPAQAREEIRKTLQELTKK